MGEPESIPANLRGSVQVLGRRIHWLLAVVVLSVAIGVAYSSTQSKEYSATAQLLVQPASGTVPIGGTQATVSSTDVLTDLQLITGVPVKAQVEKMLGFAPSISAAEVDQTNVISLTATAPTPTLAARVANTYADVFVADQRTAALNALTGAETRLQTQITSIGRQLAPLEGEKLPSSATAAEISALTTQQASLQEQLTELQLAGAEAPGGIEVVYRATPPSSPSSPKPLRDGVLALVIGLVLGIAAAFAIEYFDNKVYSTDQVVRLTGGVPVLALIPKVKGWRKTDRPMLITEVDPFSPVSEAYRTLRTSLQFAGHNGGLKTILVTSSSGSEGKTSTVANLGVVLAKAGLRVVVVGCDLRRPRLGSFLGRGESPGLTTVILGQTDLKGALQPVANTPGLALLGTGPLPPNPTELLGSEKTANTFRLLATTFDTVLIDSPPLLPVADAQVLSAYADAVLVVVAVGETTEGELARATELLTQVNFRPTGIVLNKIVRRSGTGQSGYGYHYRYTPLRNPEPVQNGNGLHPANPRQRSQRGTVS